LTSAHGPGRLLDHLVTPILAMPIMGRLGHQQGCPSRTLIDIAIRYRSSIDRVVWVRAVPDSSREDVLGSDQQVVTGRSRWVCDIVGHRIWVLECPGFIFGLGVMVL